MMSATRPPPHRQDVGLLVVDSVNGAMRDERFSVLPQILQKGDVVVVNDAATLPGALEGHIQKRPIEVRLVGPRPSGTWSAVLFGNGSWRQRTEDRLPPPRVAVGDRIVVPPALNARVARVSTMSPRLVELDFDCSGATLWTAIYRSGKPIQYSHLSEQQPLWSMQTVYAARPWAAEMPSAGRPLTWQLIHELRQEGIGVVRLTHATGLTATGDRALDAALPLPERYQLPPKTVQAIRRARAVGGRVVAVGTSVVRALEGNAQVHGGDLCPGEYETDLVISADHRLAVVDGIVSGMHQPGESHYDLLGAFTAPDVLEKSFLHAVRYGYRTHEFGDVTLIAPSHAALS